MGFSWAALADAQSGLLEREREDKLREEEIALQRENALFQLALTKEQDRVKYKSKDKYIKASENALLLEEELKGLDISDDVKAFYDKVLTDPFAASDVYSFIKTKEAAGIEIPLTSLPTFMNIIESDAPIETKIDYYELISGKDLTNKKEFYDAMQELNNIRSTPGRTALIGPKTGTGVDPAKQTKRYEDQFNILTTTLLPTARIKRDTTTDSDIKSKLTAAIREAERGDREAKNTVLDIILKDVGGSNYLSSLAKDNPLIFSGYKNNPFIKPFLLPETPPLGE